MSDVFFLPLCTRTLSDTVTTSSPDRTGRWLPTDFDCIDRYGERMCVSGVGDDTTVGEVAVALGIFSHESDALTVDGSAVDRRCRVIDSELVHGSRIGLGAAPPSTRAIVMVATWIAGPDAGRSVSLSVGTHVIGRSSGAPIRCNDRAIELHHAQVEVFADQTMRVSQLGGRGDVTVDGAALCDTTRVVPGQRIAVGDSILEVRRPTEQTTIGRADSGTSSPSPRVSRDPWRIPFVRVPRALHAFEPAAVAAPRRQGPASAGNGGLIPAVLGLVGAIAMALLLHQMMFLVFGAMGALVALGTWGAQRLGFVRSRKGADRAFDAAVRRFTDALLAQQAGAMTAHRATTPAIDSAVRAMTTRSASLWSVRASDPDAFTVSLGIGEVSWTPRVTGTDGDTQAHVWSVIEGTSRLMGVHVGTAVTDKQVIAVVGPLDEAAAVARAMVIQLAASSGPADWQLGIVAEALREWEGLAWLQHTHDSWGHPRMAGPDEVSEFVSDLDSCDDRMLVIVTDCADLLTARTSPLRRLLAGSRPVACVLICPTMHAVPAVVTSVLALGRGGEARWTPDTRVAALPTVLRHAGISRTSAHDAAATVAHLTDPEILDDSSGLPTGLGVLELLEGELELDQNDNDHAGSNSALTMPIAMAIARRWRSNGRDPAPSTPIGMAADGVIEIDLVADGPHALIAGTTGAGKSELLRSLVIGLATRLSPEQITFVLVDYKGGSTFDACVDLPHVVGVVTDLDEHLATRALRSLEAELRRRERVLRDVGAADLTSYRALEPAIGQERRVLPRLVVVIDEFATLAVQQPQFIGALLGVAQRGRSLGVHLLLATQRPSGVISDDIRANTNLRIALRVQDSADSTDVIGSSQAALLTRSIAGRAIMRLGADEYVTFQTAQCTRAIAVRGERRVSIRPFSVRRAERPVEVASAVSELDLLVRSIRDAARVNGIGLPSRPWMEPLAKVVPAELCGGRSLGIVDDPDQQRQIPLEWKPHDGHLFLVGVSGMGLTSALVSIASRVGGCTTPIEIFVIDAMGDPRLKSLEATSWCRAVVGLHERERLMRLLTVVDAARANRKDGALHNSSRSDMLVLIDGMGALRTELEAAELFDQLTQLDAIVAQGPSLGITVVAAANHAGAMPMQMLSHFGNRWVFHLADAFDAAMLGVSPAMVPAATPGRMIDARSGLEAQLGAFSDVPIERTRRLAQCELGVLAHDIDVALLPSAHASNDADNNSEADDNGDIEIPIGVSYSTLLPTMFRIAGGEHAIVLGPYRSGRSTTLTTLVHGWLGVNSTGWVASVAPRRTSARHGHVFDDLVSLLGQLPAERRALIVVDDAELVDDPTGALAALIVSRHAEVTVLAAGRPEALRSAYGHWTAAVRRSRLGVIMAACSDIDGDLLNVALPRRLPIEARPGLAWIVAEGDKQFAQIARVVGRHGEPHAAGGT